MLGKIGAILLLLSLVAFIQLLISIFVNIFKKGIKINWVKYRFGRKVIIISSGTMFMFCAIFSFILFYYHLYPVKVDIKEGVSIRFPVEPQKNINEDNDSFSEYSVKQGTVDYWIQVSQFPNPDNFNEDIDEFIGQYEKNGYTIDRVRKDVKKLTLMMHFSNKNEPDGFFITRFIVCDQMIINTITRTERQGFLSFLVLYPFHLSLSIEDK